MIGIEQGETLYQANRGLSWAGFTIYKGEVARSAPILRLQRGMLASLAIEKLERNGWKVKVVRDRT